MTVNFMTSTERRVLGRLLEIAGSPLLVEHAFAELSRGECAPGLDELVAFILEHREEWHRRAREAMAEVGAA